MKFPVSSIKVEDRFRKDMGDLESLAKSIKENGLLQPIGVDGKRRLIFGQRRLEAFKLLGIEMIPITFVDIDDMVFGEFAENEDRKPFSPSERVAIADVIKSKIGNRRGRRTDLKKQPPVNSPEVAYSNNRGVETREVAAKKAGFGSVNTYRDAKKVVEDGLDEVVNAMDSGHISINRAAKIAGEPVDIQKQIIEEGFAKKRVPIKLDIGGINENNTSEELVILMQVLEVGINRCCLSCDDPKKIIRMINENDVFKGIKGVRI